MRAGNQHTDFLKLPSVFPSDGSHTDKFQAFIYVRKTPFFQTRSCSVSSRNQVMKFSHTGTKTPVHPLLSGGQSERLPASVPSYFASETFYFVNDQVIHVEGGILSVL